MEDPREETIRKRAYEIWESEGFPEGREEEHWKQAELECGSAIAGAGAVPKSAPKAKAPRAKSTKAKTTQSKAKTPARGNGPATDNPSP